MSQASLLGWVKAKPKARTARTERLVSEWAYRFLMDFPEGIMTPDGPRGPFRKGDLVTANTMPAGVWGVLLKRGAVEPVRLRLEWPGPNGQGWA